MLFRKSKRTVCIKSLSFWLLHKWMEYNISEIKMSMEPIHISVKHLNLSAEHCNSFPPGRCISRHQEKGFSVTQFGPLFHGEKSSMNLEIAVRHTLFPKRQWKLGHMFLPFKNSLLSFPTCVSSSVFFEGMRRCGKATAVLTSCGQAWVHIAYESWHSQAKKAAQQIKAGHLVLPSPGALVPSHSINIKSKIVRDKFTSVSKTYRQKGCEGNCQPWKRCSLYEIKFEKERAQCIDLSFARIKY